MCSVQRPEAEEVRTGAECTWDDVIGADFGWRKTRIQIKSRDGKVVRPPCPRLHSPPLFFSLQWPLFRPYPPSPSTLASTDALQTPLPRHPPPSDPSLPCPPCQSLHPLLPRLHPVVIPHTPFLFFAQPAPLFSRQSRPQQCSSVSLHASTGLTSSRSSTRVETVAISFATLC